MIYDCHLHLTDPVDLILREMDRFGVDRGIVCPSGIARGEEVFDLKGASAMMDAIARSRDRAVSLASETVSRWNRQSAEVIRRHRDRLIGFAKLDLRLSQPLLASLMEEAVDLGFVGFGEILGAETLPDRFAFLLAKSADLGGFPIFVHGDYPVTADAVVQIASLVSSVPDTPVILGHLGGDFWITAIAAARETANLYLDSSEAVNLVALRAAAGEVPDKLFYGSDFPWETMGVGLCRINQLGLSQEKRQGILSRNIERVLSGSAASKDGETL